jgi:hypothetical protein
VTATSARHGAGAPRGQDPLAGAAAGRFGRMFGSLSPGCLHADVLDRLVERMSLGENSQPNGSIPAGYTYLGQFIDHDITFDPTSRLQRRNDPHALVNFRTPRFDLDSVYGAGPADQPYLYDWSTGPDPGVKLLVDRNGEDSDFAAFDLPRNRQGRALIGDARNDEHVIISQLHLLVIGLHNRVVDRLRDDHPRMSSNDLFDEARQIVRWHYQWIVIHDFLPKIVGEQTLAARVRPSSAAVPGEAAIPVEFSGAAYRFGHSMVREKYRLQHGGPLIPILLPATARGEHLGGFRRLKSCLKLDWDLFFFAPQPASPGEANPSMRIDPVLSSHLSALPPDGASLASLNLHRGDALGLPSGSDVACLLGIDPLSADELFPAHLWADDIPPLEGRQAVLDAPPLWYYVLCEAYSRGGPPEGHGHGVYLGPVGGRIVAEVLVGLLERDPHSYVHQPGWRPHLGDGETFTMLDLVRFVEDPLERPHS